MHNWEYFYMKNPISYLEDYLDSQYFTFIFQLAIKTKSAINACKRPTLRNIVVDTWHAQ